MHVINIFMSINIIHVPKYMNIHIYEYVYEYVEYICRRYIHMFYIYKYLCIYEQVTSNGEFW